MAFATPSKQPGPPGRRIRVGYGYFQCSRCGLLGQGTVAGKVPIWSSCGPWRSACTAGRRGPGGRRWQPIAASSSRSGCGAERRGRTARSTIGNRRRCRYGSTSSSSRAKGAAHRRSARYSVPSSRSGRVLVWPRCMRQVGRGSQASARRVALQVQTGQQVLHASAQRIPPLRLG